MSRDAIVDYQNRQLRRLIPHAYENVPYYRRLFDEHGLSPTDIRTVDDLSRIPITSRDVLQQLAVDRIVARGVDHRRLILHNTSGSSGKPLNIRRTWTEERLLGALRWRSYRLLGLRARDRLCVITASTIPDRNQREALQRLVSASGFLTRRTVGGFAPPEAIAGTLRALRPHVVNGPPAVLTKLVTAVPRDLLRSLHVRFVTCGAEVLAPWSRAQITDAFGAPVYDRYGAHEFNMLAWQCPETGMMHCCDDGLIMEILDGDRPVEEAEHGEVVGTNLHSFAMPFIRYRLGDLVTKGSATCPCGQPFSTIRNVRGRMVDYFHLPDGRVIHPYALVGEAWQNTVPWLREYQVTQERRDRVAIRVVPAYTPSPHELREWQAPMKTVLGPDVTLSVELVPRIEIEPSGKFRIFRSLVRSTYDRPES